MYRGAPDLGDAALRGARLYEREGCALCHGTAGVGGVANANSDTGGKINGLSLVKEGYAPEEIAAKIRDGVPQVALGDKAGPTPPLRMPPYGLWLRSDELNDLTAYLISLYPADRVVEDDWDDEGDDDDDDGGEPAAADAGPSAPAPQPGSQP